MATNNTYDVSDPTDWQGTPLASLTQVEHSLRCHVCKDFFESPMITTCCHTFCSLCIRRALGTDAKCPLCRTTDQVSSLRVNHAIREAVDVFTGSRDAMLQFARQAAAGVPATTPKRKADQEADETSIPKRTRMSTRSSSARASRATAAMMEQEADRPEETEDEPYVPGTPAHGPVQQSQCQLTRKADDGLVECPICQWRMEPQKVDRHLDTDCPGEPRPQPVRTKPKTFGFSTARQTSNTPTVTYERLPLLNFTLLNESKLKKKLMDAGISAQGNKLAMERRYKEWALMWNANCDSNRPKTKQELLRNLDVWERTQGSMAPTSSASAHIGAQIKDKNFDGAGWSTKHSGAFKDLIANARKSRPVKSMDTPPKTPQEAQPEEAQGISIPDGAAEPVELNASGTGDKALPLLTAQPETIPIERPVPIDLTSPSRGQTTNGASVPPG